MNKDEAKQLLKTRLLPYTKKTYVELCSLVNGAIETGEVRGESGANYQYEIQVVWDDYPEGWIRVIGSMDENPQKPYFWKWPLLRLIPIYKSEVMDSLIISPEGKLKEE